MGLGIETNEPKTFRINLLDAKKSYPDKERFAGLITFIPNDQGEVWIAHKHADELPDA